MTQSPLVRHDQENRQRRILVLRVVYSQLNRNRPRLGTVALAYPAEQGESPTIGVGVGIGIGVEFFKGN